MFLYLIRGPLICTLTYPLFPYTALYLAGTIPAAYDDDAWVRLTRDRRIAVDAVLDGKGAAGGALTLAIPALGLTLDGQADAAGHWSVSVPVPEARSEARSVGQGWVRQLRSRGSPEH